MFEEEAKIGIEDDLQPTNNNDDISTKLFNILYILQEAKIEMVSLMSKLDDRNKEIPDEENSLTSLLNNIAVTIDQLKYYIDNQNYYNEDVKTLVNENDTVYLDEIESDDKKSLKIESETFDENVEDTSNVIQDESLKIDVKEEIEVKDDISQFDFEDYNDIEVSDNFLDEGEDEPNLIKHESENSNKRKIGKTEPFKCYACDKVFSSKNQFVMHKKEEHKESFVCKCCNKHFKYHFLLMKHIQDKSNSDEVIGNSQKRCHICHKLFEINYFKKHLKLVHEGKIQKTACKICGKSVHNIKDHMLLHSEPKFQCETCPKKFKRESCLEHHRKRVHLNIREFKCATCGKEFSAERHLKQHTLVHTGLKLHTCELCGTSFKQKPHLKSHIKHVHEGVKRIKIDRNMNVQCGKCGKLCFNQQSLQIHEKTHTGSLAERKIFTCNFCSAAFTTAQNLKGHVKSVHEGVKPYSCQICDRKFAYKDTLEAHMPTHTGEAAYKCENCEKSFKQRSSLCTHRKLCKSRHF